MSENMPRGGYLAMIPGPIRYDTGLTNSAKLIYAEISSLASAEGYCWATDKYFAEQFGVSVATVTRAIRALTSRGYIQVEMTANNKGPERHIFCGVTPQKEGVIVKNEDIVKNDDKDIVKNDGTPSPTQYKENKKTGNNARACARKFPPDVEAVFAEFTQGDEELMERIRDWGEMRAKTLRLPVRTTRSAALLISRLRQMSHGRREVMLAMLDKATESGWRTVYELKPDEMPRPSSAAGGIMEAPGIKLWTPEEG